MKEPDSETTGERPVVATIEQYADSPDICTIHFDPAERDPSDEHATTAWISAVEGSYCSLSARR